MSSRLALYARRAPRPVHFSEMLKFGPTPHPNTLLATSRFLADEISVRLAHRHAELESLPFGLSTTREAALVREWYSISFNELTRFYDDLDRHSRDPGMAPAWTKNWWHRLGQSDDSGSKTSTADVPRGVAATSADRYYTPNPPPLPPHMQDAVPQYTKRFTSLLHGIVERHNPVVVTVSKNVPRLLPAHMPQHHPEVQAFLNRFHANRVGVRVLIGHHLALSNPKARRFPNHIGIVCTKTDTVAVAQEAATDASEICEQNFGVAPPVHIVLANQTTISDSDIASSAALSLVYIPSHLHHILFELLKNAMRATLLKHTPSSGSPIPPVTITVTPTATNISIKIADQGCGIPRAQLANVMTYAYTTAATSVAPDGSNSATAAAVDDLFTGSELQAPMAGFGYGLPLARLYARYFKGDLSISSTQGKGTEVELTLRRDWVNDDEQVVL
ncbi:mitochondrial branched-chain alpha-ketoacid dehydrogenase kinase-domain-containing protein [Powellomyces hirtus]|nr:mitochondrial branched-chain alpha-ketoacid dehydrogenase kinase-domain-containing protein [Powellomyces hirtus]